jgi:YD repeat-containing protein
MFLTVKSTDQPLLSTAYTYDVLGNRLTRTDSPSLTPPPATTSTASARQHRVGPNEGIEKSVTCSKKRCVGGLTRTFLTVKTAG